MSQTADASGDSQDTPALRTPRVTFFRFIPQARLPQRADRSAAGILPTRAFRYCEPVVTASAFGYYLFPPIDFDLMWDGHEVTWQFAGSGGWLPLKTAQFPDYVDYFNSKTPAEMHGFSPPFVGALQEPGIVQLWSGLVARTAPGWSMLVRPPANLPRHGAYELFEGIIETDRWFGPLITNMRLTKTDTPISFRHDFPVLQAQLIPRMALEEKGQNDYELVTDLDHLRPEDWDDFYDTVVRPNVAENRPRGEYAAAARKRAKGE